MSTVTHPATKNAAQFEERAARAIAEEDQHQVQTIAQVERLMAASEEPGFSGDLRRAIHSSQMPLEQIAAAAKIEVFALCDFLEGTAELTSGQITAIVQLLNLQLMRPIPATPAPRAKKPIRDAS